MATLFQTSTPAPDPQPAKPAATIEDAIELAGADRPWRVVAVVDGSSEPVGCYMSLDTAKRAGRRALRDLQASRAVVAPWRNPERGFVLVRGFADYVRQPIAHADRISGPPARVWGVFLQRDDGTCEPLDSHGDLFEAQRAALAAFKAADNPYAVHVVWRGGIGDWWRYSFIDQEWERVGVGSGAAYLKLAEGQSERERGAA